MSNRFGAFVQAVCGIGFGFLKYIDNLNAFLAFSYLLRALSGIADAASWSSVLSILMKLFPSKVARIMAWTETFFGLGFMIGETLFLQMTRELRQPRSRTFRNFGQKFDLKYLRSEY